MAASEDLLTWAARERLPTEVTTLLQEQGFTTVDDLRNLTTEDVKNCFQDTGLLKMAQSLALKKALTRLSETSSSKSSGSGFQAQSQSYPPPSHGQGYPATPQLCLSAPPPYSAPGYPNNPRPQFQPAQPHPYPAAATEQSYPPAPGFAVGGAYGSSGVGNASQGMGAMAGDTGECFRFLLLGKTGSGKSTTGNTIFGERLFNTAATFSSVTSDCDRKVSRRGGRKIEIIDSPGLYDTHKTQEEICVIIVQAVAGMHPGPHAILFVVRLGRYTAEEFGAYQRLKALFDESITRYMIVVFTHGDMLERERKSIDELIRQDTPKELQQVLRECQNRYIVFNNVASDTRPQVEHLLHMVRNMMTQNGGQPYSCPKYGEIGDGVEKEVARRLQEVEKRDLKRQKYVQQLEKQTQEAEDAARKTKKQFQKNEQERQRRMEEEQQKRQQLESQLKNQLKQQQENIEKHQQELERLHKQREEQERMMRVKEQEMTEKEKKRAKEEAEIMREREQQMQEMMRQQEERLARQREEDLDRRQQMDRERQEFMQQMEEQRKIDREEMERREKERLKLLEEHQAEAREAARRREENYEKEMEKMKQQVVDKEEPGFIDKVVNTIAGIIKTGLKKLF